MRKESRLLTSLSASLLTAAVAIGVAVALPTPSHAWTGEFTAAGNVTSYDGVTTDTGLSVRARVTSFSASKDFQIGASIFSNFPGISPVVFDAIAGGGIRIGRPFHFDSGAGIRYSAIFGTGLAIWGGAGIDISKSWFIGLPIIYRFGFSVEHTPYIGFRF